MPPHLTSLTTAWLSAGALLREACGTQIGHPHSPQSETNAPMHCMRASSAALYSLARLLTCVQCLRMWTELHRLLKMPRARGIVMARAKKKAVAAVAGPSEGARRERRPVAVGHRQPTAAGSREHVSLRGRLWTLTYVYGTVFARLGGGRALAGPARVLVAGEPLRVTVDVADAAQHPGPPTRLVFPGAVPSALQLNIDA